MSETIAKKESDGGRATWVAERDEFLVINIQAQADLGKRADSGFKKDAWKTVTIAFNERFDVVYLPAQLKSRLDSVRFCFTKNIDKSQIE
jgi:hypothetical protein